MKHLLLEINVFSETDTVLRKNYFRYKVRALITFEGFIKNFEITSTNVDDRTALSDFVDVKEDRKISNVLLPFSTLKLIVKQGFSK